MKRFIKIHKQAFELKDKKKICKDKNGEMIGKEKGTNAIGLYMIISVKMSTHKKKAVMTETLLILATQMSLLLKRVERQLR